MKRIDKFLWCLGFVVLLVIWCFGFVLFEDRTMELVYIIMLSFVIAVYVVWGIIIWGDEGE